MEETSKKELNIRKVFDQVDKFEETFCFILAQAMMIGWNRSDEAKEYIEIWKNGLQGIHLQTKEEVYRHGNREKNKDKEESYNQEHKTNHTNPIKTENIVQEPVKRVTALESSEDKESKEKKFNIKDFRDEARYIYDKKIQFIIAKALEKHVEKNSKAIDKCCERINDLKKQVENNDFNYQIYFKDHEKRIKANDIYWMFEKDFKTHEDRIKKLEAEDYRSNIKEEIERQIAKEFGFIFNSFQKCIDSVRQFENNDFNRKTYLKDHEERISDLEAEVGDKNELEKKIAAAKSAETGDDRDSA